MKTSKVDIIRIKFRLNTVGSSRSRSTYKDIASQPVFSSEEVAVKPSENLVEQPSQTDKPKFSKNSFSASKNQPRMARAKQKTVQTGYERMLQS